MSEQCNDFSVLLDMEEGTELGVSDWHTVSQEQISEFGRLTKDEDPYHVDPAWAASNSALGTTISFGFQTMSMLTYFSHQVFDEIGISTGETQLFNFGFNRVRMPEPVLAGAEIRGRFTFARARVREAGGVEITLSAVVEIRNNERPALVADWLFVAVSQEPVIGVSDR
jgi:acyl dehydratase